MMEEKTIDAKNCLVWCSNNGQLLCEKQIIPGAAAAGVIAAFKRFTLVTHVILQYRVTTKHTPEHYVFLPNGGRAIVGGETEEWFYRTHVRLGPTANDEHWSVLDGASLCEVVNVHVEMTKQVQPDV